MYVVDTNIFHALGNFYPKRFPSIWERIDSLIGSDDFISVREVKKEVDQLCSVNHIIAWVEQHRDIFLIPTNDECEVVAQILALNQYQGLVKLKNIERGLPCADPFLIAAGKCRSGVVVTQESAKPGGARIPNVCVELGVDCINLEGFLEREGLQF